MSRTIVRWWLLVTLLLGWGLRLWRLDYQELRGDEVFGYFFSLRPFAEMVQATVDLQEPHPVASYVVQQWWLGWAGHSEFALRFSSLWFGLLAVALLWRLGQALALPAGAALLATLLLAISPYAIWHSQDARMYSMSLALTTASTWLMIGWLQRQRRAWAIAYTVVSWLALHTHYFSVFVLVGQNLFVVLRLLRRGINYHAPTKHAQVTSLQSPFQSILLNWVTLQATIAFFYGPWLLRVQETLTNYHGNGDSPRLGDMVQRAGSVFLVGESVPVEQRFWWALLAGVLLGWGGLSLSRAGANGRRALLLLSFYLGVPLLATWWSATQRPIFNERYLVAAAPPFYLLLAVTLAVGWNGGAAGWGERRFQPAFDSQSALKRTGVAATLVVALLLIIMGMALSLGRHYGDPAYSKTRGWRTLAATLAQWSAGLPTERVRIAQNFPDPTLWYYYRGDVAHVVLPPGAQDEAGARAAVQEMRAGKVERVLLPLQPAPNWDDRGLAAGALATEYQLLYEAPVGVWPVQLYVAPLTNLMPVDVTFQNGVVLTGVATQPTTVTPGNVLAVQLRWQVGGATLSGTEKVFVQLLNDNGQLVAQDDRPLTVATSQSTVRTSAFYGILLPVTLPTGDYGLIAGLYDPAQPGAPRVLTTAGVDHIVIKTVTVEAQETE
ncbi:MAG: hypothetical protein DYG89_10795 [Caldilinea sp. CFX5]|nr:hypothetical protein [Caldilinea sp. CFX5]